MKTRVKTVAKFIVKPENKVVVCRMKVDMQLPQSDCWVNIDWDCWKTKAPMVSPYGEFTVTAKAKCNSDDTFDEVVGKRIAESRAKAKAFKIAKNVWTSIAENLANSTKKAVIMAKNCEVVEEVEVKHIEKLSK